jgi:hypothetical protein
VIATVVEADPQVLLRRADAHEYPIFLIHLAIGHLVKCCVSFRGIAGSFGLWSELLDLKVPVANTIREWALRVGLYILTHTVSKRNDWIWVVDLSVELGSAKCLVILGISQAAWNKRLASGNGALTHEDMSVLVLDVLDQCNGDTIKERLEAASQRVGFPVQIVSDHGSDIKKGITEYLKGQKTGAIHTYDITHASACCLKQQLKDDESFASFLSQMNQCRQQIQQTPLAFLMPPSQRTKARYFNLDKTLTWAQRAFEYYHRGDFSAIGTQYCWDAQAKQTMNTIAMADRLAPLETLQGVVYETNTSFHHALTAILGSDTMDRYGAAIVQSADLSRRYVDVKLGWLLPFESMLTPYIQRFEIVHLVNQSLKHHGLKHDSQQTLAHQLHQMTLGDEAKAFGQLLIERVAQQAQCCEKGQTWLATSDVIESLFGKYKLFSQRSPIKEIGPLILLIPLCTQKLTAALVQTALETIRSIDVKEWLSNTLGTTMFAKRRAALSPTRLDMKSA